MYAEWTSLDPVVPAEQQNLSVLYKFPKTAGKDVSIAVVKHLGGNLGLSTSTAEQPSNLVNDREVNWCLEVLCYGLSLPLSETEAVKDCVNVYCEWLTALTKPNRCVPKPIVDDPNTYGCKMIQHLYNLFVPRDESTPDQVKRQILHCHRVLRCLQKIAHESSVISEETWKRLLLLLLSINDTLLAPPPIKDDDLGSQLCERVLSVLFEIWLTACGQCFPSPPLWKTFRELACKWRHRVALIDQWNRFNLVLTSRVIGFMFGSSYPELKSSDEDGLLIPPGMSNECAAQAWFRFLHLIGNPIDLCKPGIISQTTQFFHYALSSETVIDPWQHQCLSALPYVFLKAMKGVGILVNSFLGIQVSASHVEDVLRSEKQLTLSAISASSTPPGQRKLMKSSSSGSASSKNPQKNVVGTTAGKNNSSQTSSTSSQPSSAASTPNSTTINFSQQALSFSQDVTLHYLNCTEITGRPRCNSILHLFGAWLFEASLLGCRVPLQSTQKFSNTAYARNTTQRQSSVFFDQKTSSVGMSSLPDSKNMPDGLSLENFEAGQAEAIGALCKIICSKKTAEEIMTVYLARFYLAIKLNLTEAEVLRGQVVSSILLNSQNLFRQDLDGIHVLYSAYITALEMVLSEAVPCFKLHHSIQPVELRRASINILLSILCLPLHFKKLNIRDVSSTASTKPSETFQSLKYRLINLIISAIKVEVDCINTQMLLGGLLLFVQDYASVEGSEKLDTTKHDVSSDASNHLLDSAENINLISSPSTTEEDYPINVNSSNSTQKLSSFPLHIDPESIEYPDFESLSFSESAHALFIRATYLVCHKLISSWKTDLNVSLAAIELLVGLAKIKLSDQESLECKRTVKWISDFIVYQCSRPPPAHSKDLHSTIVAAFNCLSIWLVEHPHLLHDTECLTVILEVVELGISGSKSKPKLKDVPKLKAEKENKPVSIRVRDTAESVLTCIMTQVGYFPSSCGPESLSSLLNERILLNQCNNWKVDTSFEDINKKFKYFVIDNSIILSVHERAAVANEESLPAITVIIRSPFGKRVWSLEQRHLPLYKSNQNILSQDPGRPIPLDNAGSKNSVIPQFFPDNVDRITHCEIDKSIPHLNEIISENSNKDHDNLTSFIDSQTNFESTVIEKFQMKCNEFPNSDTECVSPALCKDFQTARLFLLQFGFLSLDAFKDSLTHRVPSLVKLDHSQINFQEFISNLDKMSDRTCDTVFMFYVKSNQQKASDILQNVIKKSNVDPRFHELLLSLGWSVDVKNHSGWTGNASTSWKISCKFSDSSKEIKSVKDKIKETDDEFIFDGLNKVLYWSDASSEIAFIIPSPFSGQSTDTTSTILHDSDSISSSPQLLRNSFNENNESHQHSNKEDSRSRAFTLDLNKTGISKETEQQTRSSGRKYGKISNSTLGSDTKVIVVWLEKFEDHANFPISELLPYSLTSLESSTYTPRSFDKDLFVIYIHALKSGLYRIKMQGSIGKLTLAVPLVDGMVVSHRALPSMIRQTALNLCRRKRLELDSYQPPHIRRKLMIQDIVQKYRCQLSESEFYKNLFY